MGVVRDARRVEPSRSRFRGGWHTAGLDKAAGLGGSQSSMKPSVRALTQLPAACADPAKDFFQSFDWYQCLQETSLRTEPYILSLDGDAFLCRRDGRKLHSFTNFYTMEYGPLAAEITDSAATVPIASIDTVELRLLDPRRASDVSTRLKRTGFYTRTYFMFDNWYVTLDGKTFDQYLATRPSRLVSTIKRRRKKLEAKHHVRIAIDVTAERVRDFIAVYERSWKRPEPFPEFIPTLAETCARLGVLRLGILDVDGSPAAAQLWITTGRKAVIYKLAYDDSYLDFSVGSILSSEMFRHAIDVDHVEEIDYGVGSEPYKRDWMEQKRELHGVIAHNLGTPRGIGTAVVEKARAAAHGVLERGRKLRAKVSTPAT